MINSLVGKDRRIVAPGTFIHIPPYGRHSIKATEESPINYIYIKDRTWSLVGVAEDEPLPNKALTTEEATEKVEQGIWPGLEKETGKSMARIEGLGICYYPILDSFDSPPSSGSRNYWIEGENMVFGFIERRAEYSDNLKKSDHEQFFYILSGTLKAKVNGESKIVGPRDIIHVPIGSHFSFSSVGEAISRMITVRSKSNLETSVKY
jgi:mannose-6-phosphate isomerase-like protein (cupin superfamily)